MLASCSQDHFIRIWRISKRNPSQEEDKKKSVKEMDTEQDIKLKENTFSFKSKHGKYLSTLHCKIYL